MKRILMFLGFSVFTVAAFSQSDNLNNKLVGSVSLVAKATKPNIVINPNPVNGQNFTLELQNLEKGKYTIFLFDKKGKKYSLKTFEFDGGNTTYTLDLPKKAETGTYILQVLSKSSRFIKKMMVE